MSLTNGSGSGDGTEPDHSQSRFLCNATRKFSLACFVIAFAALVLGGGFAEISSSGAPTALETNVVRWVILGALLVGFVAYFVGGRQASRQA